MKKAITILTICLLAIAGTQIIFAQETGTTEEFNFDPPSIPDHIRDPSIFKLTKQETIEWLKQTIEDNIDVSIFDLKITPCKIIWGEIYPNEGTLKYSFNPHDAFWYVGDEGLSIKADDEVINQEIYDNYYGIETTDTNIFVIRSNEHIPYGKIADALNHLATFCDE